MSAQPLVEKYRPSSLDDVLGNETIIETLKGMQAHNNLPHMLFYGPPGTGKTTSIRAIANHLYGSTVSQNVLELNASDERGIDVVREQIKCFATSRSFHGRKKLIILDEADSMSKDAQGALRRVIEDCSGNVRFCFVVNYASKIIPAIQSRCTRFRFAPVSTDRIRKRVDEIVAAERIVMDKGCVDILVDESEGDMRRLINTLDGLSRFKGHITAEMIRPTIDFAKLFALCRSGMFVDAKSLVLDKLREMDFLSFFRRLTDYVRQCKDISGYDIFRDMADIEHRIAIGCSEEVQITCLLRILACY